MVAKANADCLNLGGSGGATDSVRVKSILLFVAPEIFLLVSCPMEISTGLKRQAFQATDHWASRVGT